MFLVTVETLYIIILVSKKRTDLKKSAYENLPQKLKNYKPNTNMTPSRILCKQYAESAWQRSITQNTRWRPKRTTSSLI